MGKDQRNSWSGVIIIKRRQINRTYEYFAQINELNNDPSVHGIIVQMPLDSEKPIDADLVTNSVLPEKDVDG